MQTTMEINSPFPAVSLTRAVRQTISGVEVLLSLELTFISVIQTPHFPQVAHRENPLKKLHDMVVSKFGDWLCVLTSNRLCV